MLAPIRHTSRATTAQSTTFHTFDGRLTCAIKPLGTRADGNCYTRNVATASSVANNASKRRR
jgi:hypothetical protein